MKFISMQLAHRVILKDILFLSLIISLFFGVLLGSRALSVPDEARYTEIPRYMVMSGDYITPRLNGIKYFEKPPLMYWLEASSIKLFGVQEWALRFWPAFLSLLTCLATYFTASRLYSRQVGIFAAIIMASSLLFNFISRLIILDVAVTCFLSLTLYSFLLATREKPGKGQTAYLIIFFISAALSVLSKGLIGIVIPGAIIVLWALFTKQFQQILLAFKPWGILLFLAVAAPWHILVAMRNPEFLWFYFVHEHFLRYLTSVHSRTQPVWFFVPLIIFGWFPWVGHFLVSLRDHLVQFWQSKAERTNELTFLFVWAGFIFAFFSVSNSKLIPYITPALPPLAIMIGKTLADVWYGRRQDRFITILSSIMGSIFLIAFCITAYARELLFQPDFKGNLISVIIILSLFILMIPILRRWISSRAAIVGNMILSFFFIVAIQLGWEKADPRSVKDLVIKIAALKQPSDKVATIGYDSQDIAPYLNQKIYVIGYTSGELMFGMEQEDTSSWMISFDDFIKQYQSGQVFYVIMEEDQLERFKETGMTDFYIIARKEKNVLITNKK